MHKAALKAKDESVVRSLWPEDARLRNYKIMVIDDDLNLLSELRDTLRQEGYAVFSCSNGAYAMKQILGFRPDLILLDLKLQESNGLQLVAEMAGRAETVNIPVLVMTGYYTETEVKRFLSMGLIRECLAKPFHPEELIQKIDRYL